VRVCVKITQWMLSILACTAGSSAFARSEYVVLERHSDVHIFERYLDYLATTSDPLAVIKNIRMEDAAWSELLKNYHNTINKVWYSTDGHVVVENKQYNFEIRFEYKETANSLIWTCRIIDDSFFFHPSECKDWKKEISYTNAEGQK
jgi:hypothetical protein